MKPKIPEETVISTSSVYFLRRYVIDRMRDAYYAKKNSVKYTIYYEISWACANEVILVAFRLALISAFTYMRMKRWMEKLDKGELT